MFFFISLYMQQVLGYDALKAGLSYLPLAVGIIVSAGLASGLTTRFGFKPVLIAGLLLTAGGLVWFSQVSPDGSYVSDILFPSLLAAVGLGFAFVPMTVAAVAGVENARGRPGLGPDQHVAAGRRRARPGDPRRDRQQPHRRPWSPAAHSMPVALTEGFQRAFMVGAGLRHPRRDPRDRC